MDSYNEIVKRRENIDIRCKTPYSAFIEKENFSEQLKQYKKEISIIRDRSIPEQKKEILRMKHIIYEQNTRLEEIKKITEEIELYLSELEEKINEEEWEEKHFYECPNDDCKKCFHIQQKENEKYSV